jgi:hypothetical protein
MSLATIIRSEFSYPGVGILAGDSLQYLSIATAHGVIMVFYMIMPLIFGAFGNFLLPTQLGVHDVAFPRLNSAAFWFLPGGLIMLMQLVCVDRRYQRMNCFNIRELQGILKRRFFTDLVNPSDHRELLSSSMIGLRFKNNNNLNLDHDALTFFKLGTNNLDKTRNSQLINDYLPVNSVYFNYNTFGLDNLFPRTLGNFLISQTLITGFFATSLTTFPVSLISFFNKQALTNFFTAIKSNFFVNTASLDMTKSHLSESSNQQKTFFTSSNTPISDMNAFYSESTSLLRFSRFHNPIISYDYKCGHYIGI